MTRVLESSGEPSSYAGYERHGSARSPRASVAWIASRLQDERAAGVKDRQRWQQTAREAQRQ